MTTMEIEHMTERIKKLTETMTPSREVTVTTHTVNSPLDLCANNYECVEVEIQFEAGYNDRFKLYIHINGSTFVRVCKLTKENFNLDRDVIKAILGTKKI